MTEHGFLPQELPLFWCKSLARRKNIFCLYFMTKFSRFLYSFYGCLSEIQSMSWQLPLQNGFCCWLYPSDLNSDFLPLGASDVVLTINTPPPSALQGYFRHQIRGLMSGYFSKAAWECEIELFILLLVKLYSLWSSHLITDIVQFTVVNLQL